MRIYISFWVPFFVKYLAVSLHIFSIVLISFSYGLEELYYVENIFLIFLLLLMKCFVMQNVFI